MRGVVLGFDALRLTDSGRRFLQHDIAARMAVLAKWAAVGRPRLSVRRMISALSAQGMPDHRIRRI